jgi:hypothetical protein
MVINMCGIVPQQIIFVHISLIATSIWMDYINMYYKLQL